MDPKPPGPITSPPTSITADGGYPVTSSGTEDFMDRTIVVKMPGTGMTVFNRYKLDRVLGRGGMGVVWLADDQKLERPVALKFLPSLIGLDPAAVKELKTETRRGLELSHPHIVRIYDFVDDDDAAAISMEFVDGKTLSELRLASEGGVFTTEEVSRWLLGVCDALDYAHFQRKVVHRDLKPANIMLTTRDAVAKIADFGIARSLSDTMSRLSVANAGASGTLPYMSPQQAMGERPLPTDDVYSLGATLYELFTGKPPFYRGDLPMQINSKVPPSVAERRLELDVKAREELPKVWEDAIASCLSKDPTKRPTCAGMLAETLGLKPITGTVRTLSFTQTQHGTGSSPKLSQKSSAPWGIIAAAAAVAAIGGAAAYYFMPPDVPSTPVVVQSAIPAEVVKPKSTADKEPKAKPSSPAPAAPKEPEVVKTMPVDEPKAPAPAATAPGPAPSAPAAPSPAPAPAPAVAATTPSPTAPAPATPGSAAPAAAVTSSAPASAAPMAGSDVPVPATAPASAGTMVASTSMPQVQASPLATAAPVSISQPTVGTPVSTPSSTPIPTMAMTPAGSPGLTMPSPAPAPAVVGPAGVPLPPGYTPTADILSQLQTQPVVADPPAGFWTVEQMFPTVPFTNYSATGKRYLLFRTQAMLKEKGLYTSTVDGKEGKGTHNAIQLFQAKSGLRPTGLLDVPTLAALQLSAEADNLAWTVPAGSSTGVGSRSSTVRRAPGGGRYTPQTEEQPNFFQRKLRGLLGEE
jgi:serine/threonine protein kinase